MTVMAPGHWTGSFPTFSIPAFRTPAVSVSVLLLCLGISLPLPITFADSILPSSIEPGRLPLRFEPPVFPKRDAPLFTEEQEEPELPVSSQDISFPLVHISILGTTVYSEQELLPLWEPRQGTEVSLNDIYDIVDTITDQYRRAGYVLAYAFLPAQRIQHGVVTLHVYEGFLQRVLFEGHIGGSKAILEEYAQKLSETMPLHQSVLERYLLLINDLPGVQAESTIRPSETLEGASELVMVLKHQPFQVTGELNNRGNSFVGPMQTLIGGQANSALGLYEQAGIRFATTLLSPDELQFLDVHLARVVGGEGTEASVTGTFSWSKPGGDVKSMGIENESLGFELTLRHPLLRSMETNIWLSGSFVFQDNSTDLFNGTSVLTRDRLRVLRFRAVGNLIDDTDADNLLLMELSQGLNIFNASKSGSANLSRTNGQSDFTKILAEVRRTQPLGAGFSSLVGIKGQYSFDSLLESQEFGLGGPVYVRAYDPSEQLGDSGVAMKLELQYGQAMNIPYLQSYQVYAFYDFGATWNRNALPGTNSSNSLDAAGAGMRATLTKNISGSFEFAKPLAGGVFSRGGDPNAPRVFFTVAGQF